MPRLYFFNPVLSPQVKIYIQLMVNISVQVSTSLKGTCPKGTSELYSRPRNPLLHPSPSPSQQAATPAFQGLTILNSLFSHPPSKCGHFQNDQNATTSPIFTVTPFVQITSPLVRGNIITQRLVSRASSRAFGKWVGYKSIRSQKSPRHPGKLPSPAGPQAP